MNDGRRDAATRELEDNLRDIDEQMQSINLVAHEAMEDRHERRELRLDKIIVLLIVLLVITNGAWIAYEMSMETVTETTTITQDNPTGNNNYNNIGRDGNIANGKADDNQN